MEEKLVNISVLLVWDLASLSDMYCGVPNLIFLSAFLNLIDGVQEGKGRGETRQEHTACSIYEELSINHEANRRDQQGRLYTEEPSLHDASFCKKDNHYNYNNDSHKDIKRHIE
jgi:hypothetical protein